VHAAARRVRARPGTSGPARRGCAGRPHADRSVALLRPLPWWLGRGRGPRGRGDGSRRVRIDRTLRLRGRDRGPQHDGVGTVNGGGATSVLLKDYPEPQRSEILDLLFLPSWGASVTTMLVEVPGDGNATQGSSPSHRRTRDDDDAGRGYTWWIL